MDCVASRLHLLRKSRAWTDVPAHFRHWFGLLLAHFLYIPFDKVCGYLDNRALFKRRGGRVVKGIRL